jgi:general secretion pathway protein K
MRRKIEDSRLKIRKSGMESGIALLVVIWLLAGLSVLALSFSLVSRSGSLGTVVIGHSIEDRCLAEAGLERGIMEILYGKLGPGQQDTIEENTRWRPDGTVYNGRLGAGKYHVRLQDESGKIDINRLNDANAQVLRNLLVLLGTDMQDADTVVDSILDWRDADELHRLNGAESQYYRGLPNPYGAKNADFEVLDELLLVRGVTPDLLYGTAERKGLIHFITLFSRTGRINPAAAPREILSALPGIAPQAVEQITALRESGRTFDMQEVYGFIGEGYQAAARYLGAGQSAVFTIESIGKRREDRKGFVVRATVEVDARKGYRYVYYKSPSR